MPNTSPGHADTQAIMAQMQMSDLGDVNRNNITTVDPGFKSVNVNRELRTRECNDSSTDAGKAFLANKPASAKWSNLANAERLAGIQCEDDDNEPLADGQSHRSGLRNNVKILRLQGEDDERPQREPSTGSRSNAVVHKDFKEFPLRNTLSRRYHNTAQTVLPRNVKSISSASKTTSSPHRSSVQANSNHMGPSKLPFTPEQLELAKSMSMGRSKNLSETTTPRRRDGLSRQPVSHMNVPQRTNDLKSRERNNGGHNSHADMDRRGEIISRSLRDAGLLAGRGQAFRQNPVPTAARPGWHRRLEECPPLQAHPTQPEARPEKKVVKDDSTPSAKLQQTPPDNSHGKRGLPAHGEPVKVEAGQVNGTKSTKAYHNPAELCSEEYLRSQPILASIFAPTAKTQQLMDVVDEQEIGRLSTKFAAMSLRRNAPAVPRAEMGVQASYHAITACKVPSPPILADSGSDVETPPQAALQTMTLNTPTPGQLQSGLMASSHTVAPNTVQKTVASVQGRPGIEVSSHGITTAQKMSTYIQPKLETSSHAVAPNSPASMKSAVPSIASAKSEYAEATAAEAAFWAWKGRQVPNKAGIKKQTASLTGTVTAAKVEEANVTKMASLIPPSNKQEWVNPAFIVFNGDTYVRNPFA